jgi:hypothetical protein
MPASVALFARARCRFSTRSSAGGKVKVGANRASDVQLECGGVVAEQTTASAETGIDESGMPGQAIMREMANFGVAAFRAKL